MPLAKDRPLEIGEQPTPPAPEIPHETALDKARTALNNAIADLSRAYDSCPDPSGNEWIGDTKSALAGTRNRLQSLKDRS